MYHQNFPLQWTVAAVSADSAQQLRMMMCPCPVRMEGVGRGLRTFAKPHQGVWGSVGGGAEHVLVRSTTRPVSLDTVINWMLYRCLCLWRGRIGGICYTSTR